MSINEPFEQLARESGNWEASYRSLSRNYDALAELYQIRNKAYVRQRLLMQRFVQGMAYSAPEQAVDYLVTWHKTFTAALERPSDERGAGQ